MKVTFTVSVRNDHAAVIAAVLKTLETPLFRGSCPNPLEDDETIFCFRHTASDEAEGRVAHEALRLAFRDLHNAVHNLSFYPRADRL